MSINIINTGLKFTSNLSNRKSTKRIILHHAATSSADVQTIHKWHLGRGWAGIGYNFYIRKDGSVYQGRGWDKVGAHCSGYNSTSIGICFEGNYEVESDMPAAQYNAGVALIAEALAKYPTITEVCGHKSHGSTACPGKYFPVAGIIADGKGNGSSVTAGTSSQIDPPSKDVVKSLQEALNLDGIRDAAGRTLVVDGIKGTNTTAAIKKVLLKAGPLVSGKYQVGSKGEIVKWLQDRLNDMLPGCSLAVDGKYGNGTRNAVLDWQARNNLTQDGKAGVDTMSSLI